MTRSASAAPAAALQRRCVQLADSAMRRVYRQIERFARSPIPILILGESGTGKEMAARAIWQIAGTGQPFVVVNGAAIPPTLVESELFGHEPGAFTGAVRRHIGLIAQAQDGILFLDEIAELPLEAQAKLLRAIETGEDRRVGGERSLIATFRLIAATHRNLEELVSQGLFRHDLLYRLGAARIVIPPLRHRLEDLEALVSSFLHGFGAASGGGGPAWISPEALEMLKCAQWSGNLREFRNVVEAAAAVAEGEVIEIPDVRDFLQTNGCVFEKASCPPSGPLPLAEAVSRAEREAILGALQVTDGNRNAAAALLGVSRATLFRKLAALDGESNRQLGSQV